MILQVVTTDSDFFREISDENLKQLFEEKNLDKRRVLLFDKSESCSVSSSDQADGVVVCDGSEDAESWQDLWDDFYA